MKRSTYKRAVKFYLNKRGFKFQSFQNQVKRWLRILETNIMGLYYLEKSLFLPHLNLCKRLGLQS